MGLLKLNHYAAAEHIKQHTKNFTPRIGLILGSGLSGVAEHIKPVKRFAYSELPNFPNSTVRGHVGELVLGHMHGVPVACLNGRVHLYEGMKAQHVQILIRTLKLLGCEQLLITNAAGSLREDIPPGELVLISDHINFQACNPMVGPNDEDFGPRFFPMHDAYNEGMRAHLHKLALELKIQLHDGIYLSVLGPNFETPAEIRAFRILGADVVGMSTVPEVIVARHCNLDLAVISVITNFACGITDEPITHDVTLAGAKRAAEKISLLLQDYIRESA